MTKNKYESERKNFHDHLTIKNILPGGIGEEIGLKEGDIILSVNSHPIHDELDFIFYSIDDFLEIEVLKNNEEIWEFEIEKDSDEELGIEFYDSLCAKECDNHCVFCFIDQMPKGMRDTLYVKDDDERLSFINGNYITLTNLSDEEIERICKWKFPVNISIHTTDKVLRRRMLGNIKADQILERIERLAEAEVLMNGQIVLVPEYNDSTLIDTLEDLINFYPYLETVSVVPVGLTQFRENLAPLRLFTTEETDQIIDRVEEFQEMMKEKIGVPFVYLSDEFYIKSGRSIPEADHYNGFKQLENGVGMLRLFIDEFDQLAPSIEPEKIKPSILLTGELFYPYLSDLIKKIDKYSKKIQIKSIENNFFGKNINVAGLVTGQDIINELEKTDLDDIEQIIIPDVMLKNDSELFLDDITITDIRNKFNKEIRISTDARSLLENLTGE